jgi:hypothetical protein
MSAPAAHVCPVAGGCEEGGASDRQPTEPDAPLARPELLRTPVFEVRYRLTDTCEKGQKISVSEARSRRVEDRRRQALGWVLIGRASQRGSHERGREREAAEGAERTELVSDWRGALDRPGPSDGDAQVGEVLEGRGRVHHERASGGRGGGGQVRPEEVSTPRVPSHPKLGPRARRKGQTLTPMNFLRRPTIILSLPSSPPPASLMAGGGAEQEVDAAGTIALGDGVSDDELGSISWTAGKRAD